MSGSTFTAEPKNRAAASGFSAEYLPHYRGTLSRACYGMRRSPVAKIGPTPHYGASQLGCGVDDASLHYGCDALFRLS